MSIQRQARSLLQKVLSEDDALVTSVQELKQKYGNKGISLVISEFINRAPSFKGDSELAAEIGRMTADLEAALKQVSAQG
jgi:hypothetical protein